MKCKLCKKVISLRSKTLLCMSCSKTGFNKLDIPKKSLIDLYLTKNLSLRKIGEIFNCDGTTILSRFKEYNISRRNQSETNKIRPISKEMKSKISKKAKERFKNPKNNPMYGKKHTIESRKKISLNHSKISGKDHHLYKPELSEKDRIDRRGIPKYRIWSQNIQKLFNYTCQVCTDKTGGNLVAHHLEGYHWCKELRSDLNNGICLCDTCHIKFHKQYGTVYNTTEQFIKFIGVYNGRT